MLSHRLISRSLLAVGLPVALLLLACGANTKAVTATVPARPALVSLTVYADALASVWGDWSWGGVDRNFANASPHHGATGKSIAVHYRAGWSGLQLGDSNGIDGTAYDTLS